MRSAWTHAPRRLPSSLLAALLLSLPGGASATEVGVILEASADVELVRGGQPEPARADLGIRTEDMLRTGPQARLRLRFDRDGGIELGPSSRIRILTPENPPSCQGGRPVVSTVSLEEGTLWIVHDSSSGPDRAAVKTTSAVICMLGTRVAVRADPRGNTQIQVWEGSVEVSSASRTGRRPRVVRKDFQTVVDKGRDPAPPYPLGGRQRPGDEGVLALLANVLGPILDSPLLEGIDPGGIFSRR